MRRWIFALVMCAACERDVRPIGDTVVGSWESLCAIRDEHATSCPPGDRRLIRQTFHPDGSFESQRADTDLADLTGTWTAHDDQVTVHVERRGIPVDLRYRAHLFGDRLVLWNAERENGSILEKALDDRASNH